MFVYIKLVYSAYSTQRVTLSPNLTVLFVIELGEGNLND